MTMTLPCVDSPAALEIRNWLRRKLGVTITVLEILKAGTIEGLGKMAIVALQDKYGVSPQGGDES